MNEVSKIIALYKNAGTGANNEYPSYPINDLTNNIAAFFAPGQCYYYLLNFHNLKIDYVAPSVFNIIGIQPKAFSLKQYLEIIHPDHLPQVYKKECRVVDFINQTNPEELPFYKFSYFLKIKCNGGKIKRLLHQSTMLTTSDDKKSRYILGVDIDVSHLKFIDDKTFSIIGLKEGLESIYNIDPDMKENHAPEDKYLQVEGILSNRELQIIKHISKGLSTKLIADALFLSEHTVQTHRRNILQKTNCANTAELVSRCLLEGII